MRRIKVKRTVKCNIVDARKSFISYTVYDIPYVTYSSFKMIDKFYAKSDMSQPAIFAELVAFLVQFCSDFELIGSKIYYKLIIA